MALTPQQLEDLRRQAEIYRDVNRPQPVVLPDKLKAALQLLSQKKRNLLHLPYPVYQGDLRVGRPPESHLAENLRERYAERGRSYLPFIEDLASRSPKKGITAQRSLQDALLEKLLERQNAFAEKQAPAYGAGLERVKDDLMRLRGLSEEKLLPFAEEGVALASDRRGQLAALLRSLQEQQAGRREHRLEELKKLGHVQKYQEKKTRQAAKEDFEDQARHPWKQAALFEEEIKPTLGVTSSSPPELQQYVGDVMDMATHALNQPYASYQGKRVAALPEDIKKAQAYTQKMLGSGVSLKPGLHKLLDKERDEKGLLNYIMPYMDRGTSDLERQAEETLRKQKQTLDAKYIRLGQYGSSQHRLEQEQTAQDMLKNLAQRQHSLLGEGIQRGLSAFHGEQMRRAQNLALLGETKEQKFRQALEAARGYRRAGTKDFLKGQKELNTAYQDFLRQRESIWPHRRRDLLMSLPPMPVSERRTR